MKYRLRYDRTFLANPKYAPISKNGVSWSDIAIFFEIKVKLNGEELLFFCEEGENPSEKLLNGYYPNSLFRVEYDRKDGYKLSKTKYAEDSGFELEFTPVSAATWKTANEPVNVSVDEAIAMLKAHPEMFDFPDNRPAQNCAYDVKVVG